MHTAARGKPRARRRIASPGHGHAVNGLTPGGRLLPLGDRPPSPAPLPEGRVALGSHVPSRTVGPPSRPLLDHPGGRPPRPHGLRHLLLRLRHAAALPRRGRAATVRRGPCRRPRQGGGGTTGRRLLVPAAAVRRTRGHAGGLRRPGPPRPAARSRGRPGLDPLRGVLRVRPADDPRAGGGPRRTPRTHPGTGTTGPPSHRPGPAGPGRLQRTPARGHPTRPTPPPTPGRTPLTGTETDRTRPDADGGRALSARTILDGHRARNHV